MAKKQSKRRGRGPERPLEVRIADLERQLAQLKSLRDVRQSYDPRTVRADRDRLQLNAADYAALVGVTPQTIYNWEGGRSQPRGKQAERWRKVTKLVPKAAWRMLETGKIKV